MIACPPEKQLRLLLQDALASADEECLEAHLLGCAHCRGLLDTSTNFADSAAAGPVTERLPSLTPSTPEFLLRLQSTRYSDDSTVGDQRSDEPLPVIPGYKLLGLLGRGGMGVVYHAEQLGLQRMVALKMVRSRGVEPGSSARFDIEIRASARLQHPNIVQIYEVGTAGEVPYFSMEYVAGKSLAAKLAGLPQPHAEAARIVEILARAVHFAHERGIVHRDLKPANILLTLEGAPKIADFGLAKLLEVDAELGTTVGNVVQGTPSYMAPEQASTATSRHKVGPATDVYAEPRHRHLRGRRLAAPLGSADCNSRRHP